jgi:lysylphosphatidylglycerol synthetase-like protein (DUF2156 family)
MPFCPGCGKPVDANVTFCPNCGYNLQAGGQAAAVPGGAQNMPLPMTRQRPTGIAILAILYMIGGVLAVLGGILIMAALGVAATSLATNYGGLIAAIGGVIGIVAVIIGLVAVGLGYGLWKGSSWAWTATLILEILGLLAGLAALPTSIVSLLIAALIIYYLFRPNVKQYFGK